jgi:hypothetical protein
MGNDGLYTVVCEGTRGLFDTYSDGYEVFAASMKVSSPYQEPVPGQEDASGVEPGSKEEILKKATEASRQAGLAFLRV